MGTGTHEESSGALGLTIYFLNNRTKFGGHSYNKHARHKRTSEKLESI